MLNGCDVSYAQGRIGMPDLAPLIDFMLVRAGYGTTIYDEQGYRNRTQARASGRLLGHWWYLPMPSDHPLILASVIIGGLRDIQPGEPILLDVEEDDPRLVDIVNMIALYLIAHYDRPPLIYLNPDFLQRYDWTPLVDLNCGLWLAHWDGLTAQTDDVAPFPFAAFKQYRCDGALGGIAGPVCLDVFYGGARQFKLYGAISP